MKNKNWLPWHLTPASSKWPVLQRTKGLYEQLKILFSMPLQSTLFMWIWPWPEPKWAWLKATASVGTKDSNIYYMWCKFLDKPLFSLSVENPSCWHTTVASALPQESSHTVPHKFLMQTSTLPSLAMLPPASRSPPVVHGAVWNKMSLYLIKSSTSPIVGTA